MDVFQQFESLFPLEVPYIRYCDYKETVFCFLFCLFPCVILFSKRLYVLHFGPVCGYSWNQALFTHTLNSFFPSSVFVLLFFFSVTYFVSAVLCIEWNIGLSYTWAFIPWACVRGLHINLFMLVWASSASEMVLACSEPWLRFHLSMGLSGGVQSILGFPYAHLAMAVSSRLTCWHFFFIKFLVFFWNL